MKVLIVGTGMYVCGRKTKDHGTIYPALVEISKKYPISNILMCSHQQDHIEVKQKIKEIENKLQKKIPISYYPKNNNFSSGYLEAIEEHADIDAAIVATPDHTHFDIVKKLMDKEIHCLCVKPLTPSLDESRKLSQLAAKKNLYGAVEFHKRYDRANLKLRESIFSQQIGSPLYFIVEYSQRKSIPSSVFKSWAEKTNIFQYLGVHYVDIIWFATGATPKKTMAIGQKSYLKPQLGIDTYDSIQSLTEWEMENGHTFVSNINVNWIDPENTTAMSDQKIKVIGTKGRFETDQKKRGLFEVYDDTSPNERNPDFFDFYNDPINGTKAQGYGLDSIEQFIKDIKTIKDDKIQIKNLQLGRPTFQDSLISSSVVEAVNISLEQNNNWITNKIP